MACVRLILTVAVLIAGTLHAQDTPPKDEIFWVDINPKDANQPRFKTYLHQPPKGVNAQCTLLITAAQWRQDLLVATDSAAHFDNCAFHESVAYIQRFLDEVEAEIKGGKSDEAVTNKAGSKPISRRSDSSARLRLSFQSLHRGPDLLGRLPADVEDADEFQKRYPTQVPQALIPGAEEGANNNWPELETLSGHGHLVIQADVHPGAPASTSGSGTLT